MHLVSTCLAVGSVSLCQQYSVTLKFCRSYRFDSIHMFVCGSVLVDVWIGLCGRTVCTCVRERVHVGACVCVNQWVSQLESR